MKQPYDPADLSSFSVLHVEDDAIQRQQMANLLSSRVAIYRNAPNGEAGLQLFIAEQPDLVITDVSMPRMNGLDMAAEMRRISQEVPIIVTTVLDDADHLFDAINLGVNRYVMKPIDTKKLLHALRDCLEVFYARRRIAEQNQELQKLISERDEFLGMAAHDLRNPISAISGLTELLLTGSTDSDQLDMLNRIQGQAEFMIRLLNDLLDLKRIEAGHISLDFKNHDMRIVLAEIVRQIQPIGDQYEIRINHESNDTPLPACYDHDRIRQVLGNLLSNALKFAPRKSEVQLSATISEALIIISVADKGPGIPEADLSKIFSSFNTTPDKDGKKGTGLGLAISRRIAIEHGGQLDAANAPNGGAVFTLTLPRILNE